VKYAKFNSLRTQQVIAQFGKSARYPVCQAALSLWWFRAELIDRMKGEVLFEKVLNRAKKLKVEAEGAIKQFRKERQEKEANLWAAQLRKIDKHLLEVQTCYEAKVGLRLSYQEAHQWTAARFNRERDVVARAGDVKALRALQRVRKRWNNKKAFVRDSDRRTLEILKMLCNKASDKVAAKGGMRARYLEAVRGGSRALSDEAWQGLLTAREIQSRLVDAPGDMDAKEVRRLAKKLGIRLAEDQRGRKRKPYLRKQQPKRPRGRPRTKPGLKLKGDIDQILAELSRESRGLPRPRQPSENQFWDSSEARRTAAQNRSANLKGKARKRRR
jgi:hypothetical protein